jgi:hypothetical protein
MILAFIEDGTLEVLADLDEARRHFDPADVESGVVAFYDGRGHPLHARFPHRSERRVLGFRVDADLGPFELVPGAPGATSAAAPVGDAIASASAMTPNRWFASLEEVRAHFAAGGSGDARAE